MSCKATAELVVTVICLGGEAMTTLPCGRQLLNDTESW